MNTIEKIVRLFVSGVCAYVLLLVIAIPTLSQTNKADIVGKVTDQNGAVVTGATVTITKVDTNTSRTVSTGDSGDYEAPGLEIGTYKVTASKQGFQTVTRENVVLQTGARLSVDITLTPGDVTGQVTVTAAPPLVETESSDRGAVVTGRQITELPLSGRNFTQLATLTPGVARANSVGLGGGPEARSFNNGDPRSGSGGPGASNENGSSESSRFNRSGGAAISANGQRATNNNFSLDGVDNNEPQFGTIGTFPNPDAIAEFKVTTSVPPAEVGRAAGAVITATIQSGTNKFHGSAYYYGQSSRLNAYHPSLKTQLGELLSRPSPSPLEVSALRKAVTQVNEFGGTFGGPIIKNRTFFFFDYSGTRNRLPFPANTTVPTGKSRNGDFSEFPTIRNPFTGQPFTGNVITPSLISSVGKNYLNSYALPTRDIFNPTGRLDCCGTRPNFFTQRKNTERINAPEIKIDHRLSAKNSLSGRFTDQPLTTLRANLIPGNIATTGFGAGEERGNSRQIAISDTHAFSPTILNEFKFGLTQIQISIFNCGVGGACGVSPTYARDIGIPNSNDGTLEASGGALIGNFNDGFLEFTGDGGLFQVKSKNPYFADTLSIVHGRHVTKFGGEVRLRRLNTIDGGRTGTLKGQFQYGDAGPVSKQVVSGQVCPAASTIVVMVGTPPQPQTQCFVRPDGIPYGGTGNSQANILMGLPAALVTKAKIFGGPFNLRSQEWGLFVQDDWKVNDRLTLNLGLRYDLFLPFSEANGRYSLFSIEQRKVIVASGGGDRIISADKNNFGPRIGVAYALNKSRTLVFRGGYGLLYTLDGVDYPPGVRNVPFSNSISVSQFDIPSTGTVYSMVTGPPTVPNPPDPANVPTDFGVFAVDAKQKVGLSHEWQASVQYQFAKDYSIDVGYVANRSRNLLYTNDIGSGGTAQALNAARQFLPNAILYTNGASSQYDGLQVQLQKRYSRNVQGQLSYTWSRTIDNNTGVFNGLGDSRNSRGGPINPLNLDQDRGRSSLDFPQLLSANALIDLPFGKGKRFLNHGGAADRIFGGWEINPILNARSGLPFSVVCSNQIQRPVLVGDPFAGSPSGRFLSSAAFQCDPIVPSNFSGDPFTDPAVRADPRNARFFAGLTEVKNAAGNTIRFGNLGRNTFRGPHFISTDLSVLKTTRISERLKFQLGFQFFNLFNHLNFTIAQNDGKDGGFGLIKNNAYPGRVIQYSAKFLF